MWRNIGRETETEDVGAFSRPAISRISIYPLLVDIPICKWVTIKYSVYIIVTISHFVLRIGAAISLISRFRSVTCRVTC